MTDYSPRRRGRPPRAQLSPEDQTLANEIKDQVDGKLDDAPPVQLADVLPNVKAEEPRRRRKKVGAAALKLAAPSRPGFTRRFFNDDGNRIADAHELGYTPVQDTRPKTPGLGSHDSRHVGTKATGEPLRALLMETPDELYAEGQAEREALAAQIDQAITAGQDATGQMSQIPGNEKYGQGSIKTDR